MYIYIYMYLCMKHTLIHHTLSRHMIYSIINSIHIYVLIKYWRELLPLDPCYFFWGGLCLFFRPNEMMERNLSQHETPIGNYTTGSMKMDRLKFPWIVCSMTSTRITRRS